MLPTTALRIGLLLALAVAASACKREQPTPADTPEAPAQAAATTPAEPQKIPGTDVISVTENTDAQAGVQQQEEKIAGLDSKTFAGMFAAESTTLQLNEDGSYRMTIVQDSAGANPETSGSWTIEADGKQLLLDPDSKSDPDARYALVSANELRADQGGQVLRREGAR